jgi:gluconokinase
MNQPFSEPLGVVIMGVSGSGKSTVGALLAASLAAPFLEGDNYHPASNVDKMSAGIALDDADRWPWLKRLGAAIGHSVALHGCAVATCSALKKTYRDHLLTTSAVPLYFVCLSADVDLLSERVSARTGHYMPVSLLPSQLAALEPPDDSEDSLILDSALPVQTLLDMIIAALSARKTPRQPG